MAGLARHSLFIVDRDSEPDIAEVELRLDADIEEASERVDRIGRLPDSRLLVEQIVDAGIDVPAAREIVADLNVLHEAIGNEEELLREHIRLVLDRLDRSAQHMR